MRIMYWSSDVALPIYAAIRRAGERPDSGRAAMLGLAEEQPELCAAFDGSAHGPAPVDAAEKAAPAGVAPQWLVDRLSHLPVPDRTLAAEIGRASCRERVCQYV